MRIELTSGKTYQVLWCGVSSIDEKIRINLQGSTISDAFSTFTNPEETKSIKYYRSDSGTGWYDEYKGYTNLKGINEDNRGIVVTLAKGE